MLQFAFYAFLKALNNTYHISHRQIRRCGKPKVVSIILSKTEGKYGYSNINEHKYKIVQPIFAALPVASPTIIKKLQVV